MLVELIQRIRNESRNTKKIELLRNYPDQKSLKLLLWYAYSNSVTFNITSNCIKIPGYGFIDEIDLSFFENLQKLSSRNDKLKAIMTELRIYTSRAAHLILNVIDKDLNIGINRKLINKAFGEELIPDFPVMLAFKQDEKRWLSNFSDIDWCYYNVKIDGIRCICDVKNREEINFYSRDGKELQSFLTDRIKADILTNYKLFKGNKLDGEIYSNNFQQLMRIVQRKNVTMDSVYIRNSVKYKIFDLINISDKSLENRVMIMSDMSEELKSNCISFIKYFKVKKDYPLISAIARKYIDLGAEGIIIKHPLSKYEPKRSNYWLKFKDKNTLDLKIIGMFEGEKGTQFENSLGGLILKYKNSELRCGSGFTEDERKEFWDKKEELIGKTCEISYMEETKTGSLRHPVFETIRIDK